MFQTILQPNAGQVFISDEDQRRLYIESQQHLMNIQEHLEKKRIDEVHEERRLARFEDYHKRRQMASVVVSIRMDGAFQYGLEVEGSGSVPKEVFPGVCHFRSKFFTNNGKRLELVEVKADNNGEHLMFRIDPYGDKAVQRFEKMMTAKGVRIDVGRTYRQDVVSQVMTILINSAEEEELPLCHGWNRKSDGNFYFVGLDQPTIEGVLKDG